VTPSLILQSVSKHIAGLWPIGLLMILSALLIGGFANLFRRELMLDYAEGYWLELLLEKLIIFLTVAGGVFTIISYLLTPELDETKDDGNQCESNE